MTEREILHKRLRTKDGKSLLKHPANVWVAGFCQAADTVRDFSESGMFHADRQGRQARVSSTVLNILDTSMTIEEMNALVREASGDVKDALREMEGAYNKIRSFREVLTPQLLEMTKEVRQHRMTTEREMAETLKWLKTVREFFMERDYDREMEKLRSFVTLCQEIQRLKDAGTLDAVADLAIKLAAQ